MTTYYVATTGSDGNAGTIGSPFLTISQGNSVLVGGDTLLVGDGTYSITSNIAVTANGTSGAHTTIKSLNLLGAKLLNNITVANNDSLDAIFFVNADFVDIVGFDVSGPGRLFMRGYGQTGAGSGSPVGAHIRVMQCYVHDLGKNVSTAFNVYGVLMGQFIDGAHYLGGYNEVSRCFFRNIGYPGAGGGIGNGNQAIYFSALGGLCANNIVCGVAGNGIKFYHFANHATIVNNLVFNCGFTGNASTGGMELAAGGAGWVQGTDEPFDFSTINNNIVRDCLGDAGIHENAGGGSPVSQIVANNTFSNNSYFNNVGSLSNTSQLDSGAADSSQLLTNQLFVNYLANGFGDYHLSSASPCLNAATASSAPTIDFDGNARPQSGGYDMGPYERTLAFASFLAHL
jgi:hypothetical protein